MKIFIVINTLTYGGAEKQAVSDANALVNAGYDVTLAFHTSGGLAGRLLDSANRPTAIVAVNDLMALGAMAAAQHRGLEIGRDLSVVGFDDTPSAESAHPPLSTVHQPVYHIAVTITSMLIQTLRGEPLAERQRLLKSQPPCVAAQPPLMPISPSNLSWSTSTYF